MSAAPRGSIALVSGCPGTGKTTLARALAHDHPRGLHLASDVFYGFPAHPVAPVRPESQAQNTAILRAVARAAAAFAEAGYAVFVDGVIGPWFLPVIAGELAGSGLPVDYAVLRAPLEETERRGTGRAEHPVAAPVVRHMHERFAALGPFEAHAIDSGARSAAAVRAEFERLRAAGRLRLDLAGLAA